MSIKDSPQWTFGAYCVELVREHLVSLGWLILRADLIENGGAPGFVGQDGFVTVADILAARKGIPRWVEVKGKTAPDLYQRAKPHPTWRHGIDASNWYHYRQLERLTSIQGWLAIVQLQPGPAAEPDPVLLMARFDTLAACLHLHEGGGDVKVWWDVDVFMHYPLVVTETEFGLGPRIVHPWEQPSAVGEAPRWSPRPPTLFEP